MFANGKEESIIMKQNTDRDDKWLFLTNFLSDDLGSCNKILSNNSFLLETVFHSKAQASIELTIFLTQLPNC